MIIYLCSNSSYHFFYDISNKQYYRYNRFLAYAFSIYGEEIDRNIAHTIDEQVDDLNSYDLSYVEILVIDIPEFIQILDNILLKKICTKI